VVVPQFNILPKMY